MPWLSSTGTYDSDCIALCRRRFNEDRFTAHPRESSSPCFPHPSFGWVEQRTSECASGCVSPSWHSAPLPARPSPAPSTLQLVDSSLRVYTQVRSASLRAQTPLTDDRDANRRFRHARRRLLNAHANLCPGRDVGQVLDLFHCEGHQIHTARTLRSLTYPPISAPYHD